MAWKRIILFLFIFSLNSEATEIELKKIAEFDDPWGSTFISNEELLLTEKSGKIKLINITTRNISEINHNLKVLEDGQGGLLDILYKNNNVWVSYSEDHGKSSTNILFIFMWKYDIVRNCTYCGRSIWMALGDSYGD